MLQSVAAIGFASRLPPDEQAEDQKVRDQQRRHERRHNKECRSEHSRLKADLPALIESE
jgi:hypothetical protein